MARRPNIERLKRKRDVDGLIEALSYDSDTTFKSSIVIALREVADANAIPRLEEALRRLDGEERSWQRVKQQTPSVFDVARISDKHEHDMATIRFLRASLNHSLDMLRSSNSGNVNSDAGRIENQGKQERTVPRTGRRIALGCSGSVLLSLGGGFGLMVLVKVLSQPPDLLDPNELAGVAICVLLAVLPLCLGILLVWRALRVTGLRRNGRIPGA